MTLQATPGHTSREKEDPQGHRHPELTAALSAMPRHEATYTSSYRGMGEAGPFYTTEYYSAIKQNEVMPFAATRLDRETFTQTAVSQTEEEKRMKSLICGI